MLKRTISIIKQQNRDIHKTNLEHKQKIKRWAIHQYGDINELELIDSRYPTINCPNDVQIQVEAASINPIDLLMLKGYGKTLISIPRREEIEFPLTLGRDFAGTVIAKGHGVTSNLKLGDKVYGFIPLHKQGTFCEIITTNEKYVLRKPNHLNYTQTASLVYASMTAWSALFLSGNLLFKDKENLRVLVIGASGGVGTAAVQLLKSQKCKVFAVCLSDAVDMVSNLGPNTVFDYKDPSYFDNVAAEGKYHIILDCCKFGIDNVPKEWKYDEFITLNSPLLLNTDKNGLIGGLVQSAKTLLEKNINNCGSLWKWGFFIPSREGFNFLNNLIENNKIKPVIHKEFNFEDLPKALYELEKGHLRGKVVLKY